MPAYFFNSLLGNIPLIGRAVQPGARRRPVRRDLHASTAPLDDPAVTVNPLAALTPGFLRGVFGIFDLPPAPPRRRPARARGARN